MARYYSDMCHLETFVYRFYDVEDRLLYVGLTMDTNRRWEKHRRREWWAAVARTDVQSFPDRESAKRAERVAINTESPLHNITVPALMAGDA